MFTNSVEIQDIAPSCIILDQGLDFGSEAMIRLSPSVADYQLSQDPCCMLVSPEQSPSYLESCS